MMLDGTIYLLLLTVHVKLTMFITVMSVI